MSRWQLSVALRLAIGCLLACGGDDDDGKVGVERPPPTDDASVLLPDADTLDDAGEPLPDAGPRDAAAPIPCDDEACEAMTDECKVAACNHLTEECEVNSRDDGTPCGDVTATECSGPDVCSSGTCGHNDLPAGTRCGQTDVVCQIDDQCDGGGQCVSFGLAPAGSACGSQDDTECDDPDSCDAFGACQPNHAGVDQQCGSISVLCRYDDYCDGAGHCDVQGPWNVSNCPPDNPPVAGLGCSCGSVSNGESCMPDVCVDGTCTTTTLEEGELCGPGSSLCCDSEQTCGNCI